MSKNQTIQHKRSSVASNKPSTAQVEIGELAINFADRSLYTQTPTNTIIELERDVIKSATQPSSPVDGDMWYDTANDSLYLWDGTAWVRPVYSGKSVLPANTTASPTWSSGAGTQASPYVFTITSSPGAKSHVTRVTVTGLAPGQLVPISDSNAASNGGRFTVSNNLADGSGVLIFNIIFNDVPSSTGGTSYVANLQVGTGTVYINVTANIVSVGPTFPQSVSFPTNTTSVTTSWTSANDTLTSTGDLLISLDGVTFGTGPLSITTGATLYTKWTGGPGTGLGIDGANGTTITGAVVSSNGASTSSSLTIDKTPATITFTAATGAALSTAVDSNTVTLSGVNSFVYLTSANTMMASVAGGTPTSVPASGTTMYAVSGQTLQVRQTSSATVSTTTTVTITAGGTTAGFSVTTAGAGTINDPSITSPITGSTGIVTTATLTSSAYAVTGIVGTHLNTDWEIYSNSGLTTLVASSMASTTNLTTWTPSGLLPGTSYWARVRYRSNDGTPVVSSWSTTVTWTTTPELGYNWVSRVATGTISPAYGVAWNGSIYVAVGELGQVSISSDGINWTEQTGLSSSTWGSSASALAIAWNGSVFCVVGAQGKVATSPDGVNWAYQAGLTSTTWGTGTASAIAWNGSVFCAVGAVGRVATSPTGVTWTYRASLSGTAWGTSNVQSIVWTGTQFVVGGVSGKIATSPTGTTWTNRTGFSSQSTVTIRGLAVKTSTTAGSEIILAVGDGGVVGTSTGGTTWSVDVNWSTNYPPLGTFYSAMFDGTNFYASASSSSGTRMFKIPYFSGFPVTPLISTPFAGGWSTSTDKVYAITWNGSSQYVAVGTAGVATSP